MSWSHKHAALEARVHTASQTASKRERELERVGEDGVAYS